MIRNIKRWSWVFILALAPMELWAQGMQVGLQMDVDKRQVEVGDTLTLILEFRQLGSGNASGMDSPKISTPENFQITGQSSSTQVTIINQQTAVITSTKLTLEATKVGTETLGPALLFYQDEKGKKKEIQSNVVSVTVVEKTGFSLFGHKKTAGPTPATSATTPVPTVTDDQLRGLKPLLPGPSWFMILLLIAIALLIVGFIWRQLAKGPKPPPVPLGKATQLRETWKKLGKEDLDAKEFCLGLSNLVRECLQYRFNFPAVDYTTEEILKALGQFKLTDDERAAAEKCLKTCDRVLYADGNLTGRDNLRTLCSALLPKVQK